MKVLVVAAEFPPHVGGVATYASALVEGLRAAGAAVHVVTSVPEPAGQATPLVTRTPAALNRKYLKVLPLFVASLVRYLRDRPDWVILMKCTHEGWVGHGLKRLLGARCVVVAYGAEILERRGDRITRAVLCSADRILVDSSYAQRLVAELGVDPRRVHVFHPGFAPAALLPDDEVESTRARYGLNGKPVLLTVARLVRHKGHDQVLRALTLLTNRHPDVIYLIVGTGEEGASLDRQIAALGLAPRVRMLGTLAREEVERLYQACDVFVMPSRQEGTDVEGLGMVYFEAGLSGKPVIGGRSGGVPDAIRDGETGFLVDPADPEDVARALDRLLSDAGLRRRMGEAGRRRVLEEFSIARSARRLREVLADEGGGEP